MCVGVVEEPLHQVEAHGDIAMVDVLVAVCLKLMVNRFGTGAVAVKGEGNGHGRELLVALGRFVLGDILGDEVISAQNVNDYVN